MLPEDLCNLSFFPKAHHIYLRVHVLLMVLPLFPFRHKEEGLDWTGLGPKVFCCINVYVIVQTIYK